ncbi:MAG: DMT family transporter [Pseudomonadota bacterium]
MAPPEIPQNPLHAGTAARPREDRALLGLAIMVFAVISFTDIDTSGKWLILAGIPALQAVFFRYAGHLLLALLVFLPMQGIGAFRSHRPWLQLLRSILLLSSTILNFLALRHLPVTVTGAIILATPIALTLLSIPLLGERVGGRRITAVLVGFLGVLVVLQPWGTAFHPAMFLSLGGMLAGSLYLIATRYLAGTETNAVSQIWSSGLATALLAPFALSLWVWPETATGYLVIGLAGLFGGLGHMAANVALRFADASLLAPLIYLQIITAPIASMLVFDEPPTFWTMIGGLIIAATGLYIWQRERRLARANSRVSRDR